MVERQAQETFIRIGLEAFQRLSKYQPLYQCWCDFALWAACQAGDRDIHQHALQDQALSKYPSGTKQIFLAVFNNLRSAIKAEPGQNTMLRLMNALELDDRDTYAGAELTAENLLLEQARVQYGRPVTVDILQQVTVTDLDCAVNNGSTLIAMANVMRRTFPRSYQERLLVVIPEASDKFSHFMAFVQLSMMGISAYTAPRKLTVYDSCGHAVFAPKEAICSPAFFSEYWEEFRWEVFLKANGLN